MTATRERNLREYTCTVCGKIRRAYPSDVKGVKEITCSFKCNGVNRRRHLIGHLDKGWAGRTDEQRAAAVERMRGALNPVWKGGTTLVQSSGNGNYGLIRSVRCPPEFLPMARKGGYVTEQRLTMARLVKRLLTRTEVVHHVDHNPLNNDPSNLELWPDNSSHKRAENGRFVEGAFNRIAIDEQIGGGT